MTRDPYNWILLRKSGRFWKKSYYASPDQLLKSLYSRVSLTAIAQPDLVKHLEACLQVVGEFYRRFDDLTGVCPGCARETGQKTRLGTCLHSDVR